MEDRNISIKSFVINKFTYDLKLKDEKEIQLEINKSAKCTFQDESRDNTFFIELEYDVKSSEDGTFRLSAVGVAEFSIDVIPPDKEKYESILKEVYIPYTDKLMAARILEITEKMGQRPLDLSASMEEQLD